MRTSGRPRYVAMRNASPCARDRSVACRALARWHTSRQARSGAHRGCADGRFDLQPRDGAQDRVDLCHPDRARRGWRPAVSPGCADPDRFVDSKTISRASGLTPSSGGARTARLSRTTTASRPRRARRRLEQQVVTADRESLLLTTATSGNTSATRSRDTNQIYQSPGASRSRRRIRYRSCSMRTSTRDAGLRFRPIARRLDEVLPLDEWHALVSHSDNDGDKRRHRVSIIDTARRGGAPDGRPDVVDVRHSLRAHDSPARAHARSLDRAGRARSGHDDVRRTPTEIARTGESSSDGSRVFADGVIAVITRTQSGRTTIDELRRGEREPSRTYQVVGEFSLRSTARRYAIGTRR